MGNWSSSILVIFIPTSQQLSICTYCPGRGRKIFVILTLKVVVELVDRCVELAILDVVRDKFSCPHRRPRAIHR